MCHSVNTHSSPTPQDIITANPHAVQGGAPFPDYLYSCGSNHSAGEAAHWTPWQADAVKYIRAQPTPWTPATEQLVAFVFGVVSHYIADISWHGLAESPSGYGFIETLGLSDFNCTGNLCSVAHTAADTGGEFVAASFVDLSFAQPLKWYVPTVDLVRIFALRGFQVNASAIEQCHVEFAAGELAIKTLGFLVLGMVTDDAAFLQEHYIDHPFGGVDDMAAYTGRMWTRLTQWLEQGAPAGPPPFAHDPHPSSPALAALRAALAPAFTDLVSLAPAAHRRGVLVAGPAVQDVRADATTRLLALLRTSPSAARAVARVVGRRALATVLAAAPAAPVTELSPWLPATTPTAATGTQNFEMLGTAVAHGDFGVAYSATGAGSPSAPQRGAVTVVPASGAAPFTITPPAARVAFNNITDVGHYARFGAALAAVDINADGRQDLCVSAPAVGVNWTSVPVSPDFVYRGAVMCFFGSANGSLPLSVAPDVVITGTRDMTMLGSTMTASPPAGTPAALVVAAPYSRGGTSSGIQRGSVFLFPASAAMRSGAVVADTNASWILHGQDPFAWFGAAVATLPPGAVSHTDAPGATPALVVASPLFRNTGGATVGKVSLFAANAATAAVAIHGDAIKGKFGLSVAVDASGQYLAVGAPTAGSTGAAYVFSVAALVAAGGTHTLPAVPGLLSTVVSPVAAPRSRFGWHVRFAPPAGPSLPSRLVVTAPLHSLSLSVVDDSHRDVGGVFVFADATGRAPAASMLGSRKGQRFGWAVDCTNATTLWVGSPFDTPRPGVDMAGSVHVLRV